MDLSLVWSHLVAAVFINVGSITGGETNTCPKNYWDDPSKKCVYSLLVAMEDMTSASGGEQHVNSSSSYWTNRTCTLWQQTNRCYQQLLRQCQSDETAYRELRSHAARTWVYSLTCSKDRARQRKHLIDCFQPHIRPTRICIEAFDKYFRNFVNDKQYRNACRVVSTAMNCFNEVKKQIGENCREEGEREFTRHYIQPLADQIRHIVTTKCEMSDAYEHYFSGAAALQAPPYTRTHSGRLESVAPPLVALLFARWIRHLRTVC